MASLKTGIVLAALAGSALLAGCASQGTTAQGAGAAVPTAAVPAPAPAPAENACKNHASCKTAPPPMACKTVNSCNGAHSDDAN